MNYVLFYDLYNQIVDKIMKQLILKLLLFYIQKNNGSFYSQ